MAVYREGLMADAVILEKTVFSDSIRKLEAEYRKAGNREAVRQVFAELFGEWGRRFREEAASLGICYLHGSILMRTGELRLTLYGKEFYLDSSRLEKAWYPPAFFRQYEQDMAQIMDSLRKVHPRIYPYEEDAVRFQYAEYYYAATEVLCRDMLSEIQESGEYRKLKRSEDFYFFFGRWRGEARKLKWTEDI